MSQTDVLLREISAKMDKMLKLLALDVAKGLSADQEKIELLDSLGFRPVEIAKLLNKSDSNVNVVLTRIRKKKEKTVKTQTADEKEANNIQAPDGKGKNVKNEPTGK